MLRLFTALVFLLKLLVPQAALGAVLASHTSVVAAGTAANGIKMAYDGDVLAGSLQAVGGFMGLRALKMPPVFKGRPMVGQGGVDTSISVTKAPIFADSDLLVHGFKGNANALAEIRAGTTYVTPNQWREFLNVKEAAARLSFLAAEGVQLFGGPQAGLVARGTGFQHTFASVARAQGRGDAALAAFARETGYEAVTMERRLFNFITLTLRDPSIPIRRIKR